MKIHSIIKSKLIPCGLDSCQFWSDSKSEIKKHITINHSSKQKLPCTLCEATFCSSGGLQKHRLKYHGVTCTLCSETFANDRKLRIHVLKSHPNPLPVGRPAIIVRRKIGEQFFC